MKRAVLSVCILALALILTACGPASSGSMTSAGEPSGGSELLEGLSQAAEKDLVVLFSFSKLSREGRVLLKHSRSAGYRTLAFVGRTCLPAEERADINLFAYRGTEKEYHSMAAPAALLDALAVAVAERLGDEGTQRLQSLHRMKKDYFPDG